MNRNYDMKSIDMKNSTKVVILSVVVVLIVGAYALMSSFYVVKAGHVGVVTHFGNVQDTILPEGLHFINPIKAKVTLINVRIHKVEAQANASSKDLQNVTSRVALNYYLSKDKANDIFQKIGLGFLSTVIQPAIQESVKSSTAQFTAEELITKRPEVKQTIFDDIKRRLNAHHIIVSDFSILDFNFSSEFNKAIEEKQVAEQRALRAKNDLARIQVESEQIRVRAEGEAKAQLEMAKTKAEGIIVLAKAEALSKLEIAKAEAKSQTLIRETLTAQILQLRMIERWDGVLPKITGGESGNMLFDVSEMVTPKKK